MAGRENDPHEDSPHYQEHPPVSEKQKRRASSRARHPFVIVGNAIFTILLLLAVTVGGAVYYASERFGAVGPLESDLTLNIPQRTGLRDMADLLKREGVIDNPTLFVIGAYVLGAHDKLKAGEYVFQKGASMDDVLETIISGKSIQHSVTIAEGLTTQQILQRLNEAEVLAGPVQRIPPEGSLLPETYRVTRGTSREQLIQRGVRRKTAIEGFLRRGASQPT